MTLNFNTCLGTIKMRLICDPASGVSDIANCPLLTSKFRFTVTRTNCPVRRLSLHLPEHLHSPQRCEGLLVYIVDPFLFSARGACS
jgi:hypothetical protein